MKWTVPDFWGIDAQAEAMARRLLPDPVVGAFLGFIVGYMAAFSFSFLGIETPKFLSLAAGVFGAIGGCVVGVLRQGPPGRGKAVGWWSGLHSRPLPFLVQRHTMRMMVERLELENSSPYSIDLNVFG
jgi:hypothetical protein